MANHLTPMAQDRDGLVRAHKESSAPSADAGGEVHPVLTLQRQVGNAQIQRMLAQREAAPEDELQTKRDPAAIQRAAAEEDELQAKRDPAAIQRAAAEEDELQAKRDSDSALQRSPEPVVGLEGGPVNSDIQGRIESKRSGGAAIDGGTRTAMEGSFGESFQDVRIHHDHESDSLNRSLGAKAFTTGNDIFFRQDSAPSDRSLLGHELTHVVQQRQGAVSGGAGMTVGPANDSFEQQADSMGATVASGASVAQPKRDGE